MVSMGCVVRVFVGLPLFRGCRILEKEEERQGGGKGGVERVR